MTHHDSTDIAALDELGRRLQAATVRPGLRRRLPRRWPAIALGVLALAATPAIASVSGILHGPERVEDALPQVAGAVDRENPVATGRALEQRGFGVHWVLITDNRDGDRPTRSRDVSAPPDGTEILSVLSHPGGAEVTADTRELMIEVAPVGSDILESHR